MRDLRVSSLAFAVAIAGGSPGVAAQTIAPQPTRGQLLYTTHCIACHNSQMHWRDGRLATDWASLRTLVRLWQAKALLNWSEADVNEVTRHLNDTIYRFPQTSGLVGRLAPRR